MTILIAEDDPISALLLRTAIEASAEEVVVAGDGEEAWRIILTRDDIRFVISDWMMPGVDGPELCRRIRGLAGRPYIYFILLTAKVLREDRLAGYGSGADDFLTKPLDRAELFARLAIGRRLLAPQDELRSRSEELQRLHAELTSQNDRLAELATCDGLTDLKNHRHFRASLEIAVSFANRHGLPLSLIMLDVDRFKAYNDAFGHPAGDEVLRALARTLRESIREHDLVARYGGEEFVLLLPATDVDASRSIAERIRASIAARSWPLRPVTASLGVATPSRLIDLADRALYRSKAGGRNRAAHADDLDRDRPTPRRPTSLRLVSPAQGD